MQADHECRLCERIVFTTVCKHIVCMPASVQVHNVYRHRVIVSYQVSRTASRIRAGQFKRVIVAWSWIYTVRDRVIQGSGHANAVRVIAAPNRAHSAVCGGAILADIMRDQRGFWATADDWKEDPYRCAAYAAGGKRV